MDFSTLVSWGFQALILGAAGLLWSEIRKLREGRREMEHRIYSLETKLAEKYVPRVEIDKHISDKLLQIQHSIQSLERHINEKMEMLRTIVERKK